MGRGLPVLGVLPVSKKLVLSVLLLITAVVCIGLGGTLLIRSFTESSSLFSSTLESMQHSDDFYQYLSMISMGLGIAILVFLKKYWA